MGIWLWFQVRCNLMNDGSWVRPWDGGGLIILFFCVCLEKHASSILVSYFQIQEQMLPFLHQVPVAGTCAIWRPVAIGA